MRSTSVKRKTCAGSSRAGRRGGDHRFRELRKRTLEHPRRLEETPGANVARSSTANSLGVASSSQRRGVSLHSPIQSSSFGPGRAPVATASAASSAIGARGAEADRRRDPRPSGDLEPSANGSRLRALDTPDRVRAHAGETPTEEWRGHQRRRQHDEQERGVEVAAENALSEPDGGEDQADFAPWNHPEPDETLVARSAPCADRGDQLADDGDGEQGSCDSQHFRFDERLDPGLDTDPEKEDRDEQVTDRRELALDPFRRGATRERETGHERTDDGRRVRGVRELRECEGERKRERNQRARRPRVTVEKLEQRRGERRAHRGCHNQEPDRHGQDHRHVADRDGAFRDETHHDGENHEAEHIVGDCCSQHRSRFDGREGAQIAEDACGDADARRRECRTDEQ